METEYAKQDGIMYSLRVIGLTCLVEYAHDTCKQQLLYVSLQHQGFFLVLRNELPQAVKSGLCSEVTVCIVRYMYFMLNSTYRITKSSRKEKTSLNIDIYTPYIK